MSSHSLATLEAAYLEVINSVSKSKFSINKEKQKSPSDKISAFNIDISCNSIKINSSRLIDFTDAYRASINENQKNGILKYINKVCSAQAETLLSNNHKEVTEIPCLPQRAAADEERWLSTPGQESSSDQTSSNLERTAHRTEILELSEEFNINNTGARA